MTRGNQSLNFGGEMQQGVGPAVDPVEFRRKLSERYEGEDTRHRIARVVDDVWPVVTNDADDVRPRQAVPADAVAPWLGEKDEYEWYPSYREHQRSAVVSVVYELYGADNDVCLLSAPTGSGKSLIIYAITQVVNEVLGRRSFVSTPLNVLVDQIENDEFLEDVITVKGRNNYSCVHPEDRGTPVDQAICQRDDNFDCEYKKTPHTSGGCTYYGRLVSAEMESNVCTNLSYLCANSMIPDEVDAGLTKREGLNIDEAHSIESFTMSFIGVTVSDNMPIDFDEVRPMPGENTSMDRTVDWLRDTVLRVAVEEKEKLESKSLKSSHEQDRLENLERFIGKVNNLLSDIRENHWVKTHDDYEDRIEFKPIYIGRFLESFLWDQGNKVVLASATLPKNGFTEEIGLDDRDVARVEVPSTFPPGRRPVVTTRDVGKMTYYERDKTIPKMVDEVARIADDWDGHKGLIHARAYSIAEKLYDRLPQDVKRRTRLQDGDRREESLEAWMDAPVDEEGKHSDEGGQVFISVGMAEGISLDDDLARWQCVCKAEYPNMSDERVSYRMDSDTDGGADWPWYAGTAAIKLQQAVGRAVRSRDDWAVTYVLDTSAVGLMEKNEYLLESWFKEAIDAEWSDDVDWPVEPEA